MVALQIPVFVLFIFLLFPKHDCKVIETVSTTIPTTSETTTAQLYGAVKENADTWMAFLYLLLVWVKTVTGTEYHPGISDPGESHGTSFDNDNDNDDQMMMMFIPDSSCADHWRLGCRAKGRDLPS